MNNYLIIDAISYLEADLLANHLIEKEKLRNKVKSNKKAKITSWSAIASSFALIIVSSFIICSSIIGNQEIPSATQTTPPTQIPDPPILDSTQLDCLYVIYVGDKQYVPELYLSESANENNVGEFIGFVSFDSKTISDIKAFEYLPIDDEINRIIVPFNGIFYVYSFDFYISDRTGN